MGSVRLIQAVKIVDKIIKKKSQLSAIYRHGNHVAKVMKEVAILKKCRHGNIVRLKEVIDDPESDKIYMGTRHSY